MTEATNDQQNFPAYEQSWDDWRIDTANYFNKTRLVHALFGFGDSVNLAISLPKLAFDETHFHTNISSAAELSHWLTSPIGVSISVSLCLFAILGNYIDPDGNSQFVFIANAWSYFRDILKPYKWVGKAVCNIMSLAFVLGFDLIPSIVIPLSLVLGGIAALERVWYRWMKNQRLNMEKDNAALEKNIYEQGRCFYRVDRLEKDKKIYRSSFVYDDGARKLYYFDNEGIERKCDLKDVDYFLKELNEAQQQNLQHISAAKDNLISEFLGSLRFDQLHLLLINHLTSGDLEHFSNIEGGLSSGLREKELSSLNFQDIHVGVQSYSFRVLCFFAVGLESLFNGMYFYSGALILVYYTPALLLMMATMSIILLFSNLVSKLNEEYSYQKKLRITASRVSLAVCYRRLTALNEELLTNNVEFLGDDNSSFMIRLDKALEDYKQTLTALNQDLNLTYFGAICEGLKNGLSLQSAITSAMFCLFLYGCPVTSFVVILFSVVSLALMILHCLYSLNKCPAYSSSENNIHSIEGSYKTLKEILSQSDYSKGCSPEQVLETQKSLLTDYMNLSRAPALGIMEYEIIRVCLAGFKKGKKAGEEMDDIWDILNTPEFEEFSYLCKIVFVLIFSLSFAARTFTKSYSGTKKSVDNSDKPLQAGDNNSSANNLASRSLSVDSGNSSPLRRSPTPPHTPIIKRAASTVDFSLNGPRLL